MPTIQCILIDDEPKAIAALAHEIQRVRKPAVHQLASFTSAQDAIDYLSSPLATDVDVVFLDIEMPDLDGLTFVDTFPNRTFDVIFTTAHSRYAIEAIKKNTFDYLIKPVLLEELCLTLERLAERRGSLKNIGQQTSFLSETQPPDGQDTRVRFEVDRKIMFISPDDIIYCEADGNYCHVFLEKGEKLFLTQQLKKVSQLLPEQRFLRVHKGYTVNLSKVKEYHRVEHHLLLSNGRHIPVSRPLRDFFLNHFRL